MNFLEARRLVAEFTGGPELPFLFALSGTPDPFRLYLQAAGVVRGFTVRPRFLPFNTLRQHLATDPPGERAAYLLLPWDLVPDADWRSGVPATRTVVRDEMARADQVAEALRRRPAAEYFYLPAPMPPVAGIARGDEGLRRRLDAIAADLGATRLPAEAFSLGSYFSSGCPVGGAWLGRIADVVVEAITTSPIAPAKVLVTDLDNTLWAGVLAEEGADGIGYRPEGKGFPHYVYQSLLSRLRREGAVLTAVSRNDPDVVLAVLRSGAMPLAERDFVAVVASYHAKSAQIAELAARLNLGLDAFVFVDDNPVELEEVRQALPEVRCLGFPKHDEDLPPFLNELARFFERPALTVEDQERTALYRRRLEGIAPSNASGSDLTAFLTGLQMSLTIRDRTTGDRTRVVQLINKTNQFNANGRRWTDEQISSVLDGGGRLYGASLEDRSGSHGEVIACLVSADRVIEALVMSCRVFQRRAEIAFLTSLAARDEAPTGIRYIPTERNEPFRQFMQDPAFSEAPDRVYSFDAARYAEAHANVLELVTVSWA